MREARAVVCEIPCCRSPTHHLRCVCVVGGEGVLLHENRTTNHTHNTCNTGASLLLWGDVVLGWCDWYRQLSGAIHKNFHKCTFHTFWGTSKHSSAFDVLLSKMMCQNGLHCCSATADTSPRDQACTLLSCTFVTMAAKGPSTLTNAPINLLALREDGKRELLALLDEVMQCVVVLLLWQTHQSTASSRVCRSPQLLRQMHGRVCVVLGQGIMGPLQLIITEGFKTLKVCTLKMHVHCVRVTEGQWGLTVACTLAWICCVPPTGRGTKQTNARSMAPLHCKN